MQLSDLPGVLERRRKLNGEPGTGTRVEDADRDLRELDEMITSASEKSQSVLSAVLWTPVVVAAALLLVAAGVWLISLPDTTPMRVLALIPGGVLVVGGVGSGVVSVVWLWAGVVLGRRCRRADRNFRDGLVPLLGSDTGDLTRLSRRDLIDLLEQKEP